MRAEKMPTRLRLSNVGWCRTFGGERSYNSLRFAMLRMKDHVERSAREGCFL